MALSRKARRFAKVSLPIRSGVHLHRLSAQMHSIANQAARSGLVANVALIQKNSVIHAETGLQQVRECIGVQQSSQARHRRISPYNVGVVR
jgi:hypothetical protein